MVENFIYLPRQHLPQPDGEFVMKDLAERAGVAAERVENRPRQPPGTGRNRATRAIPPPGRCWPGT